MESMQATKRVIEINPIHSITAKKALIEDSVNSSIVSTITAGSTLTQTSFRQSHLIYTKPNENSVQNMPLNLHSKSTGLPEISHNIKNGSKQMNG
jgi:hypothetical protein